MTPVDPGPHWLEAGITGLSRQREWDAVATADAPGEPGDEAELVVLADGRVLVEHGPSGLDPTPLVRRSRTRTGALSRGRRAP